MYWLIIEKNIDGTKTANSCHSWFVELWKHKKNAIYDSSESSFINKNSEVKLELVFFVDKSGNGHSNQCSEDNDRLIFSNQHPREVYLDYQEPGNRGWNNLFSSTSKQPNKDNFDKLGQKANPLDELGNI